MIKAAGIFFAMVLLAHLFFVMESYAEQPPEYEVPDWLAPSSYSYSPAGIDDPFVPFIQPEVREPAATQPERPRRPLTPLEKVEVSQLKLVGIIWGAEQQHTPSAMVELPDGKGFILKTGTVVGPNMGQVVSIRPDQVLVMEEVTDIFGVTREKMTTLRLRPGQDN